MIYMPLCHLYKHTHTLILKYSTPLKKFRDCIILLDVSGTILELFWNYSVINRNIFISFFYKYFYFFFFFMNIFRFAIELRRAHANLQTHSIWMKLKWTLVSRGLISLLLYFKRINWRFEIWSFHRRRSDRYRTNSKINCQFPILLMISLLFFSLNYVRNCGAPFEEQFRKKNPLLLLLIQNRTKRKIYSTLCNKWKYFCKQNHSFTMAQDLLFKLGSTKMPETSGY